MRMLFLLLLLVNVAAFGYIRYAESRSGADAQIALLQISPDKVKVIKPGERKPKAAAAQPALVCLEWGGFTPDEAARAAAELAKLGLGDKVTQRESGETYWVYIPPLKSKADADKKAGELKSLGISDFSIVQEEGPWRFALALGEFKTEDAAAGRLAQLRQKGVRSAVSGARGAKKNTFVIRDPGDAAAARIAGLKDGFPNAELKAAPCAEALAVKN